MDKEIKIILIGQIGAGKSATGNIILGRQAFLSYDSKNYSVTEECQTESAERFGRLVQVVDTPELFGVNTASESVQREILRCVTMTSPGPHAVIFVVRIGASFQPGIFAGFKKWFGEAVLKYTIVLFTNIGRIDQRNLGKFVNQHCPNSLKRILKDCESRYMGFIQDKEDTIQVLRLLDMIDDMITNNGGSSFTNEIYRETEIAWSIQQRLLEDRADQKRLAEIEAIERRHATEIEQLHQKHNMEIADLSNKHEEAIEALQDKCEEKTRQKMADIERTLQWKHDREIENIREEHEFNMRELRRKLETLDTDRDENADTRAVNGYDRTVKKSESLDLSDAGTFLQTVGAAASMVGAFWEIRNPESTTLRRTGNAIMMAGEFAHHLSTINFDN